MIDSFAENTDPVLVHAFTARECVPAVKACDVVSVPLLVEYFETESMYSFIAVITCPEGAPATADMLTGDATEAFGAGEQIVTVLAFGVHDVAEVTLIVSDAVMDAPVFVQATTTM